MKSGTCFVLMCALVSVIPFSVYAQETGSTERFKSFVDVRTPSMPSPVMAVWEADISGFAKDAAGVQVYDMTEQGFVPSRLVRTTQQEQTPRTVVAPDNADALMDGKSDTSFEFSFDDSGVSTESTIVIQTNAPIEADTITLTLDGYVALPHTVSVRTVIPTGASKTLVAPRRLDTSRITFPRATASQWIVTLSHTQPLRLAEIEIHERDADTTSEASVRFLADPTHTYRVYAYPERSPNIDAYLTEMPDLMSNEGVIKTTTDSLRTNPAFVPSDVDEDTIPDVSDNCVEVSNFDQTDLDGNKRGDACDDFDRDRLINAKDNCPSAPNANQRDTDSDGMGDVCDMEESRFTEKHAWIPWAGIGFAAFVIIVLGALALRMKPEGQ